MLHLPVLLIFLCSLFHTDFQRFFLLSFSVPLENCPFIVGLLVTNSSYSSSESILISPSFMMDIFANYRILDWQFLFWSTSENVLLYSLAFIDSDESLTPWFFPTVHTVTLRLLSIFFLSLVFRSLIMRCLNIDFFGFILFGFLLASSVCKAYVSPNLGHFQPWFLWILFQSALFLLLSGTSLTWVFIFCYNPTCLSVSIPFFLKCIFSLVQVG